MPRSSKSSLTLSIHLLLCLPLLLSPLTFSCSAAFGSSLFPSILSTCLSHVSLLLIFSITVSSAPSSSLVFSFPILSLLLLPLILLNHAISATKVFSRPLSLASSTPIHTLILEAPAQYTHHNVRANKYFIPMAALWVA